MKERKEKKQRNKEINQERNDEIMKERHKESKQERKNECMCVGKCSLSVMCRLPLVLFELSWKGNSEGVDPVSSNQLRPETETEMHSMHARYAFLCWCSCFRLSALATGATGGKEGECFVIPSCVSRVMCGTGSLSGSHVACRLEMFLWGCWSDPYRHFGPRPAW